MDSVKGQLYLSEHTIVFHLQPGLFVFYQVLLRKGVAVDVGTISFLTDFISGHCCITGSKSVRFYDMSCFSLKNCLLDNPSGIRCYDPELVLSQGSFDELIKLLKEYAIIVSDEQYVSRFGKKSDFFDRSRLGNFHQQIGDYLLFQHREKSDEWWICQKFERDLSKPKLGLYQWVQQAFLESYFKDLDKKYLLDFGCGVGYYSAFFAKKGANVLGVDPNPMYIQVAKDNFSSLGKIEFQARSFERKDDFQFLEGHRFDCIFLCDVFLYYFEPYKPMALTPAQLLSELRRFLAPQGRIYICDPHGCFHLQAWFGRTVPYLISTEYKHRRFRVTPTLEEISLAVETAGMSIKKIRECYSQENLKSDSQNAVVAKEFPLWWFFEIGE